ncbi:MAG TPA: biopolymer transporter ExbD [Polyangia bacterium]|nr:biopolymer transporter ExbD [Polyangia bacterium]
MSISLEESNARPRRRKEVSADLLLVPYIDLLTCMIAFLLITAVWTQLARLEVQQRGQGGEGTGDPAQTKIAVLVHEGGFALVVNQQQDPLPQQRGEFDFAALEKALTRLKQQHPDKTDVQILSEDPITFDTLVKTMDAAMASGFPNLSLLDAESRAH